MEVLVDAVLDAGDVETRDVQDASRGGARAIWVTFTVSLSVPLRFDRIADVVSSGREQTTLNCRPDHAGST